MENSIISAWFALCFLLVFSGDAIRTFKIGDWWGFSTIMVLVCVAAGALYYSARDVWNEWQARKYIEKEIEVIEW